MSLENCALVREAARSDHDQWLPLWDHYNSFCGRSGPSALPDEISAATWDRFFDSEEPVHCLVAEHEGRLVGLAHYLFHRSTTAIDPTCYLQDLFTAEEARGRGVGRSLVCEVYERARTASAERVYWQTHESNAAAQRLYESIAERSDFIIYKKML